MSTGVATMPDAPQMGTYRSDEHVPRAVDQPGLSVLRHATLDAPGLRQAWADLSHASPAASLFTTYEWCRCWAESVGLTAAPAILQMIDDRGRTVGIAPLGIERAGAVRWLEFMGRDRVSGDHLDVLCTPEYDDACLPRLLKHIEQDDLDYDGIILGELEPGSRTLAEFTAWAKRHGHPVRQREQRVVPFITLPETFDEFLASLSSNMRYHVRRRRRGLAQCSPAGVELARDAGQADKLLDDFFELHRRRWERDGQPGNFRDQAMQQFLRSFCRIAADCGWLRCYALRAARRTQAVMIAFHWKDTAYYYQMGWDPDSPIASPGVILMAESIEQAIRERLRQYDFLRGDEPYKLRWTSQAAEQTTLVIGCRMPAKAAMLAEQSKNAAKVLFQRCLGERNWQRARGWLKGASA